MKIKTANTKTALVTCLFALTVFFTSCNKQPAADFSTDKSEYTAGEIVKLTNKSINGNTYKWTLPDNQTSASLNVDYALPNNTAAGNYYVKLEAISKKGNKVSEASKSFTVKDAMGTLVIWTSNQDVDPISVLVDNVPVGVITHFYNSTPSCGAMGCVTANLKAGTHTIFATDGYFEWKGTMSVTKNKCSTFELQ
jgi:methionine-rich copper-binding protein CopC